MNVPWTAIFRNPEGRTRVENINAPLVIPEETVGYCPRTKGWICDTVGGYHLVAVVRGNHATSTEVFRSPNSDA